MLVLSWVLSNWRLALGIVAVAAVMGLGYALYHAGYQAAREDQLAQSVKILRDRKVTDDKTHGLSDAELCSTLGGVWNSTDSKCM